MNTLKRMVMLLLAALAVGMAAAAVAAPPAQPVPKVRPYAGIGVLTLAPDTGGEAAGEKLAVYRDPGLVRIAGQELARLPRYEPVFSSGPAPAPLIVSARRGEWLRVAFDEAGREGWVRSSRRDSYLPWEGFLKLWPCRMLPGLRKGFYQLHRIPANGALEQPLTPRQLFKVLRVEGDWVMAVLSEQSRMGWLRWRDEDGRLLVSFERAEPEKR